MHTEVKFTGSERRKREMALTAVQEFLGLERFERLVEEFRQDAEVPEDQFRFLMAIGGIEGFAVEVFRDFIYAPESFY